MAVSKCVKCGADIPEEAAFCPSCGASKSVDQPVPPPVQQQTYQPTTTSSNLKNVSPLAGIFDMAFSKTGIILVTALGILFLWIGTIIRTFAVGSSDIATLLSSMGAAAMGLFLIGGGIWNHKINKYVRLGIVVVGGVLIVASLTSFGASGYTSYLSSLSDLFSGLPSY